MAARLPALGCVGRRRLARGNGRGNGHKHAHPRQCLQAGLSVLLPRLLARLRAVWLLAAAHGCRSELAVRPWRQRRRPPGSWRQGSGGPGLSHHDGASLEGTPSLHTALPDARRLTAAAGEPQLAGCVVSHFRWWSNKPIVPLHSRHSCHASLGAADNAACEGLTPSLLSYTRVQCNRKMCAALAACPAAGAGQARGERRTGCAQVRIGCLEMLPTMHGAQIAAQADMGQTTPLCRRCCRCCSDGFAYLQLTAAGSCSPASVMNVKCMKGWHTTTAVSLALPLAGAAMPGGACSQECQHQGQHHHQGR